MGSRPMRDINGPSPDLTDDLPAHALTPCLAVRQDAVGRRKDAPAESAPPRRDAAMSDVGAQARPPDPANPRDDRAASLVIPQADAQHRGRLLFHHPRTRGGG